MSPISFLRKLRAIPMRKQMLLAEATIWLTVARVALKLVPFPKIGRYLGTLKPPSTPLPAGSDEEARRVRQVGWAVNTAGSHLPVEMVCLPRALAGWQMLHRRGISSRLHFGALKQCSPKTGDLQTHAWLTAAGVEVTGYPVAYTCVELGYFSRGADDGR